LNKIDMPTPAARPDEGLKTLFKVMRILGMFSRTSRSLSLAEISQRSGYPKSTTHRLLSSMREAGLLDQDRNRDTYRLGLRLYELGNTVLANMDLLREARPYIEALGRLTDQVVHLAVFDGNHAVVIGKSESQQDANSGAFLESAPAHCTSVGKAILSFLPEAALETFLAAGLQRFTDTTVTDPAALREELELTKSRGYSIDQAEHQPGLHCVGAPIRDLSGRVFAAVSVSGPAWKMPLSDVGRVAKIVIHHADAISRALGYQP
jgi:DNA-binding IclR family transcriptional regulator